MTIISQKKTALAVNRHRLPLGKRIQRDIMKNWKLYLMFLPILAYFLVFKYGPMAGLMISFQDFKAAKGIMGSKWVGM